MTGDIYTMNDATRAIAKEAAAEAVHETFAALGIDISEADEIRHFQANMAWVFRFRRLSERVGSSLILAIVTTITGLGITWLWDRLTKRGA